MASGHIWSRFLQLPTSQAPLAADATGAGLPACTRAGARLSHVRVRPPADGEAPTGRKPFSTLEATAPSASSGTSKTCGNCGFWNAGLGGNKTYECPRCKIMIDHDVNGARNNFLAAYGKAVGVGWDGESLQIFVPVFVS